MKLLNKINGCHSSQYVCESVWRLKMTLYHPLWTITKKFLYGYSMEVFLKEAVDASI